jgi:hypothetical protein
MKKILLVVFALFCTSILTRCASSHEAFHFVKVLGITHAGDTVLIDVNSLRPRVYNSYQYNNTIPYYNSIPYHPQIIIRPNVSQKPRPTIVTPSGTKPVIVKPPSKPTKNNNK